MGVLMYDLMSLLGSTSQSLRFKSSVRKILSTFGGASALRFFPM